VLTETMERRPEIGLDSYDRFFPNQDTLSRGGFGNLIALPLQHGPRKVGTRASLMAGRALEGSDQGALVCSCFGVGTNPIAACARELGAAATPAEIGKRLKCGTNCGSCIPEIQVIIGGVSKKSA
jgi:hypothetical protein